MEATIEVKEQHNDGQKRELEGCIDQLKEIRFEKGGSKSDLEGDHAFDVLEQEYIEKRNKTKVLEDEANLSLAKFLSFRSRN